MDKWKELIEKKSVRMTLYGIGLLFCLVGMWWVSQSNQEKAPVFSGEYVTYEPQFSVQTTQATSVWKEGVELSDQAAYFFAAQPIVEYSIQLGLEDIRMQDLTGEITTQAFLVSENDAEEEYWRYPLFPEQTDTLAFKETENGGQQVVTYEPLDMTQAYNRQEEIGEELDFYNGNIEVVYDTTLAMQGTADGKPVEKTFEWTFPFALQDSYFTAPPVESFSDRQLLNNQSNTQTSEPRTVWHILADYGLLILAAVIFLVLLIREWVSMGKKERTIEDERKRYKEWITDGKVSLNEKTIVKVHNLEGLVDLAIDLDKRVIHDREYDNYAVLEDSFVYIYDPAKENNMNGLNEKELSEILLEMKLISPQQLQIAQSYQAKTGDRLGDSLINLGFLDETALYSAMAKQFGLPFYLFNPQEIPVKKEWLAGIRIREFIQYEMVPVGEKDNHTIILSTANPVDKEWLKRLEESMKRPLEFVMSPPTSIRQLLDRYDTYLNRKRALEYTHEEAINYAEEKKALIKRYQKGNLDLFAFVYLSNMATHQQLLAKPEHQGIAKWLVRKNIVSEEIGHLLRAFKIAVGSLPSRQARKFKLPSIIRVLEAGGYVTDTVRKQMEEQFGTEQESMLVYMVDHFYISRGTKDKVIMLYDQLDNLLSSCIEGESNI